MPRRPRARLGIGELGLGLGASEEEGELALSRYVMLECWKKANKAADREGYGSAECGGGVRAEDGTRAALALGFERDKWNQIVKFSKDRTRRAHFSYNFRKNKSSIWICTVDVEPGGFPA